MQTQTHMQTHARAHTYETTSFNIASQFIQSVDKEIAGLATRLIPFAQLWLRLIIFI